jgi:hypothetical protein
VHLLDKVGASGACSGNASLETSAPKYPGEGSSCIGPRVAALVLGSRARAAVNVTGVPTVTLVFVELDTTCPRFDESSVRVASRS